MKFYSAFDPVCSSFRSAAAAAAFRSRLCLCFLERLEKAGGLIELVDELIELGSLRVNGVPGALGVVPERVEVLDVAGLLLDPGVILEVVDALAVGVGQLHQVVGLEAEHVEVVVELGFLDVVRAVHLVELLDAGLIHRGGVGQNRADDIVLGQLIILRHLDAAKDIRDAGDAEPGQLLDQLVGELELFLEVLLAFLGVEQAQQALAVLIVDGDGHVGVLHVVDPGNVLVADALDAVAAEAVLENGGALQRLAHAELEAGIALLEQVARAHGAGGAGGEAGAGKVLSGLLDGFKEVREGVARDVVVPEGIAHLLELVEDHHAGILLELPGLVEDLLDVGLAAGRSDDLTSDLAQPVEALLAHLGGENGDGVNGEQLGVERAAAAVVARGGPNGVVIVGVELAGDQTRSEAAEGSADLVAAGGEPLARHGDDAAGYARKLAGDLYIVGDLLKEAAGLLGLVLPGDAEEVEGVDVPQTHVLQLGLDLLGNGLGMLHLRDGGDDDVVFLGLLDVMLQSDLVDAQIDFTHFACPPVVCQCKNKVYILKFRNIWRPCRRTW